MAQGRVWTGAQAYEVGLVDELGGLRAAANRAKRALGIAEDADVALITYPAPPTLSNQLRDLLDASIARAVSGAVANLTLPLPRLAHDVQRWLRDLPLEGPLLIPPFWVDIH